MTFDYFKVLGDEEPEPDTTAPQVTAAVSPQPPASGTYTTPVTVTLSATDASTATGGVIYTEYRIDGGAWLEYTAPVVLDPATLGAGAHTLGYRASDASGNVSPVGTVTVTFAVPDTTAPTVTATVSPAAPASGWWRTPATVTLAATDDRAGTVRTEYRVDGGAWTAYTAPVVLDPAVLGDGTHSLEYRATDAAGNVSAVGKVEMKVDRTGPVVTTPVTNGQVLGDSRTLQLSGSATDALSGVASVQLQLDGVTVQAGALELWTLPLGRHTLVVTAVDQAGNTSTTTVTFVTTTSLADIDALVAAFAADGRISPAAAGQLEQRIDQALAAQAQGAKGKQRLLAALDAFDKLVDRRVTDDEVASVLLRDSSAVAQAARRG